MIDRWEDLDTFNPNDIELLFYQDDTMDATLAYPGPSISLAAIRALGHNDLAHFFDGLCNAVLLPLNAGLIDGMRAVLEFTEAEARERVRKAKLRTRYAGRADDWEAADLLAEIASVTGPLQRRGREWWACCPFQPERTPSFHVDPAKRVWRCFGCQRGGGVLAWRHALQERAA